MQWTPPVASIAPLQYVQQVPAQRTRQQQHIQPQQLWTQQFPAQQHQRQQQSIPPQVSSTPVASPVPKLALSSCRTVPSNPGSPRQPGGVIGSPSQPVVSRLLSSDAASPSAPCRLLSREGPARDSLGVTVLCQPVHASSAQKAPGLYSTPADSTSTRAGSDANGSSIATATSASASPGGVVVRHVSSPRTATPAWCETPTMPAWYEAPHVKALKSGGCFEGTWTASWPPQPTLVIEPASNVSTQEQSTSPSDAVASNQVASSSAASKVTQKSPMQTPRLAGRGAALDTRPGVDDCDVSFLQSPRRKARPAADIAQVAFETAATAKPAKSDQQQRVKFAAPEVSDSDPLPSLLKTITRRQPNQSSPELVERCPHPYVANPFVSEKNSGDADVFSNLAKVRISVKGSENTVKEKGAGACNGCSKAKRISDSVLGHKADCDVPEPKPLKQQAVNVQPPQRLRRTGTSPAVGATTMAHDRAKSQQARAKSHIGPQHAKSEGALKARSSRSPTSSHPDKQRQRSPPPRQRSPPPPSKAVEPQKKPIESTLGLKPANQDHLADTIREALASEAKARRFAGECFLAFDLDGNGLLNFEELRQCMRQINVNLGIAEFRERDVEYYMRRFDTNQDNHLSCEEFEDVYRYLLLMKLNAEEPMPFCREMFIGRHRGKPVEHYDIVDRIGKGSYGVVHKVVCKTTKSVRVMKTINKRKAEKGGLPTKLVMEEISKLKTLDHPAVLRLFEYYVDAEALYLITDLLPGGDLSQQLEKSLLKKKPLEDSWVRTVFRQVCEGVNYTHGKGVMHKDLKLDNVMLSSVNPPEAVIIDVGLAELFPVREADQFHSSEVAGTLATMAPEVIARSFTYKCDVWSLGCCYYALCVKKPIWYEHEDGSEELYPYPFRAPDDDSSEELERYVRRQLRGPDLSRTTCNKEARNLCRSMLAISEKVRPTMQQVLAHPWFQQRDSDSESPPSIMARKHLDCLMNFNRANALEEAILLDVASQLPLGELRELRALFEEMDKDGDGRLDAEELAEGMQRAGLEASLVQQAAQRFAHAGSVEFSRFIAALVPSCRELLTLHLRDAFNRLDVDGDGFITMAELQGLLEHGKLKHLKASRAVRSIFEALRCSSAAGSRRISFERLSKYFMELCV